MRTATTIEQVHRTDGNGGSMRWAVEATYEGSVRFSEPQLEDPSEIVPVIDGLTRWIASTLIHWRTCPSRSSPPRRTTPDPP